MVSRKALLIAASIPKGQDAHFIPAELEAAKQFLLSTAGGAWEADEIKILRAPSLHLLETEIKNLEVDYSITWFFGKSFPDSRGNHFLVIEENDFIKDTDLLNGSDRQLLLIDDSGGSSNIVIQEELVAISELRKARAMYDRWIESCEAGKVIMHATESSNLKRPEHLAGIFTRKLLEVASNISPASNRFHLKSILTVGHETPDLLLEEGFEEGPVITWSEGNVKLPFALALPMPAALLPVMKSDQQNLGWSL